MNTKPYTGTFSSCTYTAFIKWRNHLRLRPLMLLLLLLRPPLKGVLTAASFMRAQHLTVVTSSACTWANSCSLEAAAAASLLGAVASVRGAAVGLSGCCCGGGGGKDGDAEAEAEEEEHSVAVAAAAAVESPPGAAAAAVDVSLSATPRLLSTTGNVFSIRLQRGADTFLKTCECDTKGAKTASGLDSWQSVKTQAQ